MQRQMVVGGAGQWVIKDGKFYDPVTECYVVKCCVCKKAFYAGRLPALTCGDACRQAKSRKERDVNHV